MIQNIILSILGGIALSSIVYYFHLAGYRKKMVHQLDKNQKLIREKLSLENEIQSAYEKAKILQENFERIEMEYKERLESQRNEHERVLTLQKENLNEQLNSMEAQFKSLSEEITRKRSEELSENNKKSMNSIIQPLRETMLQLEKELKDNNLKGAERIGSLKEQITSLMAHTTDLGTKADHLSQALLSNTKAQGIWGETILEKLLQSEGLEKNVHYETQKYMIDEGNNKRFIDVLIHLPEDKALMIDSKVSLNAYTQYHAASEDNQEERKIHLAGHIKSIKDHIKELSQKEYYKLQADNWASPEFVIMFVPIPGALQLALEEDPTLYDFAKKQRVYLSNSHSILPIIWVIKDLWAQAKQEQNLEEIIKHAQNLLNRLNNFFTEFEKIEISLRQAVKAYENADRKIRGRQGVLSSAKSIQNAGIKLTAKDELPPILSESQENIQLFE